MVAQLTFTAELSILPS